MHEEKEGRCSERKGIGGGLALWSLRLSQNYVNIALCWESLGTRLRQPINMCVCVCVCVKDTSVGCKWHTLCTIQRPFWQVVSPVQIWLHFPYERFQISGSTPLLVMIDTVIHTVIGVRVTAMNGRHHSIINTSTVELHLVDISEQQTSSR